MYDADLVSDWSQSSVEEGRRGKGTLTSSEVALSLSPSHPLCRGMRSGTLPAPLLVGLGAACELAGREMEVCTIQCSSSAIC